MNNIFVCDTNVFISRIFLTGLSNSKVLPFPKIIVPKNQVSDSEIEECLDEAYKVLEAKKKAHYKINNKQLSQKMDRLSDKAVNNGMTSEMLEDIF